MTDLRIPLSVPHLAGNEWRYIKDCLDGNWVSSAGPFVTRFEDELARYVGSSHAVATVNGTAALHIALMLAGVEADSEVLVPALTFIAPVNSVRYCNAWPIFMDVDQVYMQMDPQKVVDFLSRECRTSQGRLFNKITGRRISAVLPVHIYGHPVDLDPILQVARKYGLAVVEDATESLGSLYRGRATGHLADIACFSFNGNKIITTGGGGMIVTDNDVWAERARYLTTQAKDDPVEFVHNEVGYNYRLTNIQAAMGVAQLEQLDGFILRKRGFADRYAAALEGVEGLKVFHEAPWAHSTYWLNAIELRESRRPLMEYLNRCNIEARPLWHPIHSLPPYRECMSYKVEIVDHLYEHVLSLPSSVGMTSDQQERVIASVESYLGARKEIPAG